jgi:hypothetical protein
MYQLDPKKLKFARALNRFTAYVGIGTAVLAGLTAYVFSYAGQNDAAVPHLIMGLVALFFSYLSFKNIEKLDDLENLVGAVNQEEERQKRIRELNPHKDQ